MCYQHEMWTVSPGVLITTLSWETDEVKSFTSAPVLYRIQTLIYVLFVFFGAFKNPLTQVVIKEDAK